MVDLYVEEGPLAGQSFGFSADRLTLLIGRSDENVRVDVDLGHYGGRVSRRHLSVRGAADGLWVTDLGSRNGTLLDGEYLEPHSERFAAVGSRLQLAPPDGPLLLVWQRSVDWGGEIQGLERAQDELQELRAAYTALQEENRRLRTSRERPDGDSPELDWEQCAHLLTECQDELSRLRLTLLDQPIPSSIHGMLSKVSTRFGDLRGLLLAGRRAPS